jgi:hypothetical protein
MWRRYSTNYPDKSPTYNVADQILFSTEKWLEEEKGEPLSKLFH